MATDTDICAYHAWLKDQEQWAKEATEHDAARVLKEAREKFERMFPDQLRSRL